MTFIQWWELYANILSILFPIYWIWRITNPHKCQCGFSFPIAGVVMRHRELPHKHVIPK